MIRNYGIGNRAIAVTTQRPEILRADALVLPWAGPDAPRPADGALAAAGDVVLQEIAEYGGEREVMLTSGGALPQRFLFHLSLPANEKVDLALVEDRFRECFFQAGVLGLQELAVAILDFSPHVESFSELVGRVWVTTREFLARERGPRRLLFLVDDRDLRGQYLRHFLDRKQAEDHRWEGEDQTLATPLPPRSGTVAAAPLKTPGTMTEQVLSMELADVLPAPEALEAVLDALLSDYAAGRDSGDARLALAGPMNAALDQALSNRRGRDELLSSHLRVLGSPLVMRLPWELLPARDGRGFLGEDHLFTRGTNFLHFRRRGVRAETDGLRTSLRVVGESGAARQLAQGVQELVEARGLEVFWSTEQEATARLIHCLDLPALDSLLAEGRPDCELVLLDLPPGASLSDPDSDPLGERARELLAHGCRHVLAPLAPFREVAERDTFRAALYERLLGGASVGGALHYAQRVLMEAHGPDSGWWLYRLFGQTDCALLPARSRGREAFELVP